MDYRSARYVATQALKAARLSGDKNGVAVATAQIAELDRVNKANKALASK
jgi:hypothetical protein